MSVSLINGHLDNTERCVCCGRDIPEGRQYCVICGKVTAEKKDMVEVVRCKDCTEWDKNECECSHWYGFRENDFCSYGVRKGEE